MNSRSNNILFDLGVNRLTQGKRRITGTWETFQSMYNNMTKAYLDHTTTSSHYSRFFHNIYSSCIPKNQKWEKREHTQILVVLLLVNNYRYPSLYVLIRLTDIPLYTSL